VVHDLFLNKEHIGNGVRQKSQGITVEKEQKSESDRERSRLDWQQKVWAGKRKATQGGVSNVQVSVWAKSHTQKHSSRYTYTNSKTIEESECNNNNGQNCVLPILMREWQRKLASIIKRRYSELVTIRWRRHFL